MKKISTGSAVDVWRANVSELDAKIALFESLLTDEERQRAARFIAQVQARRYICAHGLLRSILSRYTGLPPADIIFSRGQYGKPVLLAAQNPSNLYFNMSHSGDMLAYACCFGFDVGVDIEDSGRRVDCLAIADRFFTPGEAAALRKMDGVAQRDYFFYLWTRKEALLKATGRGLSQSLAEIDVRDDRVVGGGVLWAMQTESSAGQYCLSVAASPAAEGVNFNQVEVGYFEI